MILTIILSAILVVGQPVAAECDSIAIDLSDQGKYIEAVEMAQRGIDAAEKSDDMDSKISCLCTMSTCYVRLGELDKAIECIRIVYEYDQKSNNPSDLSYDMNILAGICHNGGRNEEAAEYIQKSIEYARLAGTEERGTLAIRLGNAADIFRSQGKYAQAENYAKEAYTIDKEDGRVVKVPIRLCQLAGCLAANGKTDEAISSYKDAINQLEVLNNRQSLAIACRELGGIIKSDSEAIPYLQKALSLSKELGSARDIIDSNIKLASRLQGTNPANAYKHLSAAYALRDSLLNQERTAEIDKLNVEYKTLEKESQIERAKSQMRISVLASSLLFVIALLLALFASYVQKSKKELDQKNEEMKNNLKVVSENFAALTESHSKAKAALAAAKEDNSTTNNIPFTAREMDIIKLSCKGMMSKEIAAELGISVKTVDNIKSGIFHKIGVGTTLELVIYAIHNKLDK